METQFNQLKNSFFQSTTVRMATVGFLTLILLIPLEFVKDLISERSNRKKEVVEEVSNFWGKAIFF